MDMSGGPLTKRVRALSKMDYDEVSLVDVPANQHALVMITKRHDEGADMTAPAEFFDPETLEPLDEADLQTGDVVMGDDERLYEYTAPEDVDEFAESELVHKGPTDEFRYGLKAGRIMGHGSREATGGRKTERASDYISRGGRARRAGARAGFYNATTSGRTKALHGAAATGVVGAGVGAEEGARRHYSKSFSSEIAKALAEATSDADRDYVIEEFAKRFEDQQAELDQLAEIAKSERDQRLEAQYIEVAKSMALPEDPDVLGPVLKRMSDVMDKDDVAIIAKLLDSVSGILYEEFGYEGFGPDTGSGDMADAEAAAEARIAKANGQPISKAAGIEQYYAENPDAYEEYMANRR